MIPDFLYDDLAAIEHTARTQGGTLEIRFADDGRTFVELLCSPDTRATYCIRGEGVSLADALHTVASDPRIVHP